MKHLHKTCFFLIFFWTLRSVIFFFFLKIRRHVNKKGFYINRHYSKDRAQELDRFLLEFLAFAFSWQADILGHKNWIFWLRASAALFLVQELRTWHLILWYLYKRSSVCSQEETVITRLVLRPPVVVQGGILSPLPWHSRHKTQRHQSSHTQSRSILLHGWKDCFLTLVNAGNSSQLWSQQNHYLFFNCGCSFLH